MLKSLKVVGFLALTLTCLVYASSVLRRKYRQGMIVERVYFNSAEYDILCCGSSHAYCAVIPMEMYRERGLRTGVIATRSQPIECTYYYLKEAFSRKRPKVVLLESYMICSDEALAENRDEAVLHDAIVAFPGLANKLKMAESVQIAGNREDLYFDLLKYHGRWQELTADDYTPGYVVKDFLHGGHEIFTKKTPLSLNLGEMSSCAPGAVSMKNLGWVLKIRDLVRSHGARLIVFTAPYKVGSRQLRGILSLAKFLEAAGVEHVDFFQRIPEVGLDLKTDFFDSGHLNFWGAQKVSRWFAERLKGDIADNRMTDESRKCWDADLEKYDKYCLNNGVLDLAALEEARHLKCVASIGDLRVQPGNAMSNYLRVPVELQPGRVYVMRAETVEITHGKAERVLLKLSDEKKIRATFYHPLKSSVKMAIPFAVPDENRNFLLHVAAGDPLSANGCKGVGVVLKDVTLEMLEK